MNLDTAMPTRTRNRIGRTNGTKKFGQKIYSAWSDMKARCLNPSNRDYINYGGRGISVCDEWQNDFLAFVEHIGQPPSERHSIDRIDNNKNYEPGNVRWATYHEQRSNTRLTRTIIHNGITQTLTDWSRDLGITTSALHRRLSKGWPLERALSSEKFPRGRKRVAEP